MAGIQPRGVQYVAEICDHAIVLPRAPSPAGSSPLVWNIPRCFIQMMPESWMVLSQLEGVPHDDVGLWGEWGM